jgi:hypothetical protein
MVRQELELSGYYLTIKNNRVREKLPKWPKCQLPTGPRKTLRKIFLLSIIENDIDISKLKIKLNNFFQGDKIFSFCRRKDKKIRNQGIENRLGFPIQFFSSQKQLLWILVKVKPFPEG